MPQITLLDMPLAEQAQMRAVRRHTLRHTGETNCRRISASAWCTTACATSSVCSASRLHEPCAQQMISLMP